MAISQAFSENFTKKVSGIHNISGGRFTISGDHLDIVGGRLNAIKKSCAI